MRITKAIFITIWFALFAFPLAFGQGVSDKAAVKILPSDEMQIQPLREGIYRLTTSAGAIESASLKTTAPEIQENVTKVAAVMQYNAQRLNALPIPDDIKEQCESAKHISLVIADAAKEENIVRFRLKPTYVLNKSGTRRLITQKYAQGELWEINLETGGLQLLETLDSWGIVDF